MKKILIFTILILFFNLESKGQRVCALGNFILERNDFSVSKNILAREGFSFLSMQELKAFGHNPKTKIIATKGYSPSNSMMVVVDRVSSTSTEISKIVIICAEMYALYLDRSFTFVGYSLVKNREYIQDGRFKIVEDTYHRTISNITHIVVIKYNENGGAEISFTSKRNYK